MFISKHFDLSNVVVQWIWDQVNGLQILSSSMTGPFVYICQNSFARNFSKLLFPPKIANFYLHLWIVHMLVNTDHTLKQILKIVFVLELFSFPMHCLQQGSPWHTSYLILETIILVIHKSHFCPWNMLKGRKILLNCAFWILYV